MLKTEIADTPVSKSFLYSCRFWHIVYEKLKEERKHHYDFQAELEKNARLMILLTLSDMMREGNQLAREVCFLNASPDL